MLLIRLTEKLDSYDIPYCIVGGLAVALHGVIRGTMDIDIVIHINLKNLTNTEKAFKELGLVSRIPITAKDMAQFRQEYIIKKNLVAWSFTNPKNPGEVVDIIITHDLKDFRSTSLKIYGKKISLISVEDLIEMKLQSGRPQDLEDAKALKLLKGGKS